MSRRAALRGGRGASTRGGLRGGFRAGTPPILGPDGNPAPGAIASLEKVQLGEVDQWVLLRGRDVTNPVLVFLGGGPGGSEIDQIRRHGEALERRFTVVTWEQRGAGKSLAAGHPRKSMTIRQLTADALELVGQLRERFGQRKVFLVGHSLGTVLAVRMVQERPEWFHAYVGIGQIVNQTENDRMAWQAALDGAVRRGHTRTARRLRGYGPPPYQGRTMTLRYALVHHAGSRYAHEDHGVPVPALGWRARPPEYTLLDRLRCPLGLLRTFRTLYPRLRGIDLLTQASRLEVPVYLLTGAAVTASSELVERYFDGLTAPHKELVRFEQSGHSPCFEQPERFARLMIEQVLPHGARQHPAPH